MATPLSAEPSDRTPVVIDDGEASLSRLNELGKTVVAPSLMALHDAIMGIAVRRSLTVVSHSSFVSWVKEQSQDGPSIVLDPLFPEEVLGSQDVIVRIRRTGGSDFRIDPEMPGHDLRLFARNQSVVDDAAFSGTTLCHLASAIEGANGSIKRFITCAASWRARERLSSRCPGLAWVNLIEGNCEVLHLRDICPCLPFAGRPSRDADVLMTAMGPVRITLAPFLVPRTVWGQLGRQAEIWDVYISAVRDLVRRFSEAIGRSATLADMPLLGPNLGFPVFPRTEVDPMTHLQTLIE